MGEDQDARPWHDGQELLGDPDPIVVRQAHVHEDDVRLQFLAQPEGRLAIGRLSHHHHVALRIEQGPQPCPQHAVVIDDQDFGCHWV
jgi:hypothetical protein